MAATPPNRRSIRLTSYDYGSAGGYFLTICTQDRECLFGEILDGVMALNETGSIVHAEWDRSAEIRKEIELDEFVVMPNHIHGIVFIKDDEADVGATGGSPALARHPAALRPQGPTKKSLGAFVAGFKQAATIAINRWRETPGAPVWQRNYYEHVIRDEDELNRVRRYISDNPGAWLEDADNPDSWSREQTGDPPVAPTNERAGA